MSQAIIPLIMCGGAGTRLWPASREGRPKQFLRLFGPHSTFQATLQRVSDPASFGRPKRIVVKAGGRRSLQKHHHRAEHWVVVRGTARVTIADQVRTVHENESIYIPIGTVHRLENPGKMTWN